MNIEFLFDLVCANANAAGRAFKFNGKTVTERAYTQTLTKAVQAFVHEIANQHPHSERAIQAFNGSSSLPQLTKDVFNVTMQVDEYDLLWQNAFRGVSLKKGQLNWEIADVASSIVFELIPEGGKVKFEGITGSKVIAGIKKYGAGLGITWETIEGRKLYKFVEQMEAMRSALYTLWGDTHYGLLATAGALNSVAWQGVVTDRTIDRDILTLNEGSYQNGFANKDKGYGDMANARFQLYANSKLRPRINAALRATSANVTMAGGTTTGVPGVIVDYNIDPYYTFNSNIGVTEALLVLPGRKIQNAAYMRELGLTKQEIESLNELRTYWTAFGAVVGDTDQVYLLNFA